MLGQPPAASAQAGAGTASSPHLWVLGGQWVLAPGGSLWRDKAAQAKGISSSAVLGFQEGGRFFKYGLRVIKVLRLSVKITSQSSQRSSSGFVGAWAEQNWRPGDLKSSNINVTEKIMFDRKQRFTTNVSLPWGLTGRLPRTFLIKCLGISSGVSKQGRIRRTDVQGRGPAVTEHVPGPRVLSRCRWPDPAGSLAAAPQHHPAWGWVRAAPALAPGCYEDACLGHCTGHPWAGARA